MTQPDNTTPHASSAYDQAVRQTIPFYEVIDAETVDLVQTVRPDAACWLDTGCGTGFLAELALPLFPRTRFVLADPSEAMLEQAAKRFAGVPAERLRLLPPLPSQRLLSLKGELEPQVISAVLCHQYLQADERGEAVRACYELRGAGGLFIAFENIAPCTPCGDGSGGSPC